MFKTLLQVIPNFEVGIFEKDLTQKKIKTVLKSPAPVLSNAKRNEFCLCSKKEKKTPHPNVQCYIYNTRF